MSQAGEIDVINSNPQIPTMFGTNSGTAIPLLNELDIVGINGITTSGAGNTVTINGAGLIGTLTGNSGGAVPPFLGNISTIGAGSITVVGSPGTFTLTTQLTGMTNHAVLVGAGTTTLTKLAVGTNGQVLIGATGADPAFATLTSTGGTITFTAGANSLNLEAGGAAATSFVTNLGTAIPVAGVLNDVGSGSITTTGSGNTVSTFLTGMTNHAVLVGAGTTTLTKIAATANTGAVLQNNSGADPSYSTATYPSTTTVSQILYSSATNVVSGLATANRAVLTTGTTGIPVLTAIATDGQMIIGSTAGAPAAGTITSTGGTITVTTGSNTLNLEVVGGGFTWTDVTGATQAMSIQNGYITDRGGGVVYTLPATAALGSEIIVMGKLGLTTITPNANQQILMDSASGTVGVTGTIIGTNVGDCVTLIATTSGASTVYRASSWVGNWTVS